MMNLEELATKIHTENKAKGWWDIPRPRVQTAWLVITELAEATEAERKGRYADRAVFESDYNRMLSGWKDKPKMEIDCFKSSFLSNIKDTFEDEIADAVIRLLDLAESEGVIIEIDKIQPIPEDQTAEDIFFYVSGLLGLYKKYSEGQRLATAVSSLIALSEKNGFDLWWHIETKLKYNATRPAMHGGKKF